MNSITIEYSKTKDLEKKLKEHYELVAGVTIEEQIANAIIANRGMQAVNKAETADTTPDLIEGWEEKSKNVELKDDPVANPTVMDIIEEHKAEEIQNVQEVEPAVEEVPTESEKEEPTEVEERTVEEDPIVFATKVKEWVMADKSHAPKFKTVLDKHGVGKFSPEIMTDELQADLAALIKEA